MKSAVRVRLGVLLVVCAAAACAAEQPAPPSAEPGTPPSPPSEPVAPAPTPPPDAGSTQKPLGIGVVGGALFQGVKLPLFGENATKGALPVVVNRPGVLRVYVKVLDRSQAHETRLALRYKDAAGVVQTLRGMQTIRDNSTDAQAETCVDVAIPASAFHPGLAYQVEVRDGEDRLVARFPEMETDFTPLPANPRTQNLKVMVVPVQYTADGSGRLPDTSAVQLQRLSEEMRALYPVSEVQLAVRAQPLEWATEIGAGGEGWDELLYGILRLRETDAAADDVYYYGAFAPGSTLQSFCASGNYGCVLGLSELSRSVQDAGRRGSIGLGFTGEDAAETFTHEVGHAHGRYHAPCGGAGGPDSRFPYADGSIGVTGWDVRTSTFVFDGGRYGSKDFMSYCTPAWVSDYTWKALFTRIVGVSEELSPTGGPVAARPQATYRLLRVDDGGKPPRWLGTRTVRGQVSDTTVGATLASGAVTSLPQVELDHLPGHVVYVPLALAGQTIRVGAAIVTVP